MSAAHVATEPIPATLVDPLVFSSRSSHWYKSHDSACFKKMDWTPSKAKGIILPSMDHSRAVVRKHFDDQSKKTRRPGALQPIIKYCPPSAADADAKTEIALRERDAMIIAAQCGIL